MRHPHSNLEWLDLQLNTLFRLDTDGRMATINELGFPRAPRLFLARSNEGNIWRLRNDLPSDLAARLDDLCRSEPVATDFKSEPQCAAAIRTLLAQQYPIRMEHRGPAFYFPKVEQQLSRALLLDESNTHLLRQHFEWMLKPIRLRKGGPVAMVVEGDAAVAVCFCSRLPKEAAEAGVNTVEAFRGRGYAQAAVRCWAAELYRQSIVPLYSTDWGNLASQAIARNLGAQFYGEDWSIH